MVAITNGLDMTAHARIQDSLAFFVGGDNVTAVCSRAN
ncbi:hypothetical protein NDI54_13370 [Haloarcula sp. S1AR25-5A]|uniref:Uncharacterized protein n=2 Tax=Haloarcula terrestris TaxID=2950533 RepID=A0AAE4F078_9EURY|nr:hypothetical protein [Haloarcula terrestris]MDS0222332.1 hypothetical protein [Haloarcula terrestris]